MVGLESKIHAMSIAIERCKDQMPTDECIVWPGRFSYGYPYVRIGAKNHNITRVMVEMASGEPFPSSYTVRPACGNARCIRFTHLELHRVGPPPAQTKEQAAEIRARIDVAWAERAQAIPEGACSVCGTFCNGDVIRCVQASSECLNYMRKTVGTDDQAA